MIDLHVLRLPCLEPSVVNEPAVSAARCVELHALRLAVESPDRNHQVANQTVLQKQYKMTRNAKQHNSMTTVTKLSRAKLRKVFLNILHHALKNSSSIKRLTLARNIFKKILRTASSNV